MSEHTKLNRLLSFILLLLGPRKYDRPEIQERFGISKSTFHRNIKLLRECGIIVEEDKGLYSIRKIEPEFKEISELLHFTQEEAAILHKAIDYIDDENLIRHHLALKLYSIYDFDRIPKAVYKSSRPKNIESLQKAIKNKRQVVLVDYQSAHSQLTRSRLVEPFDFTFHYQMVWAYEVESGENKQFKLSRIKEVQLKDAWENEQMHQKQPNDVFRMTGDQGEICELRLSLRAANLLKEEYPASESFIKPVDAHYSVFKDMIYNYQGVGRFCLSLLNEIEIVSPEGLKQYVDDCIKNYQQKK